MTERSKDANVELIDDGLGDEEDDINIVDDGSQRDVETQRFDTIVGALEDVLMDPEFEEVREGFCRANCRHFEDSDENKLIYTDLFSQYTSLVESTIDRKLREAVPGFSMEEFTALLQNHQENLMSDVFDLLLSLADFEAFKELMLSYKHEVADGGSGFQVNCTQLRLHTEDLEQEEGDARPDLDTMLQISPMGSGPNARR